MTALQDSLLMQDMRPQPKRGAVQETVSSGSKGAPKERFDTHIQKAEDTLKPEAKEPAAKDGARQNTRDTADAQASKETQAPKEKSAQPAAQTLKEKGTYTPVKGENAEGKTRIIRLPVDLAAAPTEPKVETTALDDLAALTKIAQTGTDGEQNNAIELKTQITPQTAPTATPADPKELLASVLVKKGANDTQITKASTDKAKTSIDADVIKLTDGENPSDDLDITPNADALALGALAQPEAPQHRDQPRVSSGMAPQLKADGFGSAQMESSSIALQAAAGSSIALNPTQIVAQPEGLGGLPPALQAAAAAIDVQVAPLEPLAQDSETLGTTVTAGAAATQAASASAPTANGPLIVPTTAPTWVNQISNAVTRSFEDGTDEFEVTLTPENLGRVQLKIAVRDGIAMLQVVTETPEAAKLFTETKEQLAQSLKENGLDLGQHTAQSDGQAGQNNQGSAQAQRGRGVGALGAQALINETFEAQAMAPSRSQSGVDLMA